MPAKETDTHRPSVPLVRIFLSSPGDVAEERKQARELIDGELMKRPHLCGRGALQVIAWDDPAARIPMLATETPQASVNAARPRSTIGLHVTGVMARRPFSRGLETLVELSLRRA